jgi:beta-lactamase regulating signal transducer with metallopeptidase domain
VGTVEQMVLSNAVVATLLALLAAAVSSICRRPALVHSLWLLVLIKLITPPIVPVEVFHFAAEKPPRPERMAAALPAAEPQESDEPEINQDSLAWIPDVQESDPAPIFQEQESGPVEDLQPRSAASMSYSWSTFKPAAAAVWLAGSLVWLAIAGYRVYRFQRLLAHGGPAAKQLQDQVQHLTARLGLTRCPKIWLVPGTISPMIWPVGARPRLLVPAGLLDRLSVEQCATLLVHELAHLRRRDHWVRALELVVTGLFWWHPVVWWARREIAEAEEQCCDAWVVWALPEAARSYASALLETVDFLAEARPVWLPPAASGLGQFRILKRRLHMIMIGNTPKALSRAGFLAVLGLGVLLPVLPTWGQQSGDDDKQIDKKEIKKSVDDILKQVDIEKIKKIKDDVIKDLDKDLIKELEVIHKLAPDTVRKIQEDVIKKLDSEGIRRMQEDVVKQLEDAISSVDDPKQLPELKRAKEEIKKALAQLKTSKIKIRFDNEGEQSKDPDRGKDELRRAEAQLAEAKARFQKAQEELKAAQRLVHDLERQVREVQVSRARQEAQARNAEAQAQRAKKDAEAQATREQRRAKEAMERSRSERGKDTRRSDDDLEQRFEKLLKEVQDLGRELKRRRSEERRPPTDGEVQ